MEQIASKYGWVLAATRSANAVPDDTIQKLLAESFIPGRKFKVFLCGAFIEVEGTLEEMENAYEKLKSSEVEDFNPGDFGIVSIHGDITLLFLPTEIKENEDISRDSNFVQL